MLASSTPSGPEVLATAQKAFRKSTIEIWKLLGIGLRPDDYRVWFGVVRGARIDSFSQHFTLIADAQG
ncbi:hypothetical protein FQN55_005724 [Onygenales sp. PD_40]|nr:hypothetical protein FQN55_005724 [Onygenales sp. PD_40]